MNGWMNRNAYVIGLLVTAATLRFGLLNLISQQNNLYVTGAGIIAILLIGAGFVLQGTANIIEETTEILSEKTKIAGGVLQSLGTAFPDMALGIVAALVSVRLMGQDYAGAISYAIIAAATTFGSNIYNIGHAIWCIYRQNLANNQGLSLPMFPAISRGGRLIPMREHKALPALSEIDTAISILNALTLLTAAVAICMVLFGKINHPPGNISGDLYQLIQPAGIVVGGLAVWIIYKYRKSQKPVNPDLHIEKEERYYRTQALTLVWVHLIISGAAILLTAETMVHAIRIASEITHLPLVIAGALTGIIGCLGEMMVVHNYSINPKGRIGDALVGVAMDNIVTTLGAAIVAVIGGIFLGGNALIIIFVIILTLNTSLIWQISTLKSYLVSVGVSK